MIIRLKEQKLLQGAMLWAMLSYAVVSFTVFAFMQVVSYLCLGLCFLSFIVMALLCLKHPRMTKLEAWTTAYFVLLIVFTLLNGTSIKDCIYNAVLVFLLLMLFNYFADHFDVTVKACALIFSLIIYANLAIMIMFPDWMFAAEDSFYSYLLGGNYNQMGGRMICGLITNLLCLRFGKVWLINIIPLFIISMITLLMVGSMTSSFCILLFILLIILPSLKLQKWVLAGYFCFYILFQTIVCFSGEGLHNNPIAVYIIEDFLGKDLSFSYRTTMWDAAGKLFAQSPIWGYGWVDNDWYLANLSSLARGPHNFIYSILLNGGLLLMTVFLAMCWLTVRQVLAHKIDRLYITLLLGIQTWLFMGTMEVYPPFFIVYLMLLAYNYPSLQSQTSERNDGNQIT